MVIVWCKSCQEIRSTSEVDYSGIKLNLSRTLKGRFSLWDQEHLQMSTTAAKAKLFTPFHLLLHNGMLSTAALSMLRRGNRFILLFSFILLSGRLRDFRTGISCSPGIEQWRDLEQERESFCKTPAECGGVRWCKTKNTRNRLFWLHLRIHHGVSIHWFACKFCKGLLHIAGFSAWQRWKCWHVNKRNCDSFV